MPWNRKNYPPDWEIIVADVRVRANGRCECEGECGLHLRAASRHRSSRCKERDGHPALFARGTIMLTTAHLCHETRCDDRSHLKQMCQRCHLRYDRYLHAYVRRKRQDRESGQLQLLALKPLFEDQILGVKKPRSPRH